MMTGILLDKLLLYYTDLYPTELNHNQQLANPNTLTVYVITFGSQVIWQYKMDLFPVAVRGSAIISCGRTAGGSEYKFWSFCNTQFVPVLSTVYLLHELKAPI